MKTVFTDKVYEFQQYNLQEGEEIFQRILQERKGELDSERFYLKYISDEELSQYDFNNPNSLCKLRKKVGTYQNPIKLMGGYNLRYDNKDKDIRDFGIKISDPYGKISGQFDFTNQVVTYSPIFPFFYEERDLIKWAEDDYVTNMTFEEIVMNQINCATKYYVHTGDYDKIPDIIKYGSYIMEEVTKQEMIEYAINPEAGEKILRKYRN